MMMSMSMPLLCCQFYAILATGGHIFHSGCPASALLSAQSPTHTLAAVGWHRQWELLRGKMRLIIWNWGRKKKVFKQSQVLRETWSNFFRRLGSQPFIMVGEFLFLYHIPRISDLHRPPIFAVPRKTVPLPFLVKELNQSRLLESKRSCNELPEAT